MSEPGPGFPKAVGRVVFDSLSPIALATGFLVLLPPVLVFWAVKDVRSPGWTLLPLVVGMATHLLAVSRFSVNTLVGETEGGLLSDAGGGFGVVARVALRAFVLLFLWILPVVLWSVLRARSDVAAPPLAPLSPFALPMGFGPPPLLTFYLALGIFVPLVALIVATASADFRELFSGPLWKGLFGGKSLQLLVALSGQIGAPVAALLLAFPFLLIVTQQSWKGGVALGIPVFLFVTGLSVAVHGRLAGSWVAAAAEDESVALEEPHPAAGGAPPAPGRPEPVAPRDAATPDTAGLEARALELLRSGDDAAAVSAARQAIPACLAAGDGPRALSLFRSFLGHANQLGLDRGTLTSLGDLVLKEGDLQTAAWAFWTAMNEEPSNVKAYKGLLKIAEQQSARAETVGEAIRIYEFLLQAAPGSPFADHARDGLLLAQKRARSGPAGAPRA